MVHCLCLDWLPSADCPPRRHGAGYRFGEREGGQVKHGLVRRIVLVGRGYPDGGAVGGESFWERSPEACAHCFLILDFAGALLGGVSRSDTGPVGIGRRVWPSRLSS